MARSVGQALHSLVRARRNSTGSPLPFTSRFAKSGLTQQWSHPVAVPKKKKSKMKTHSHRAGSWRLSAPARSVCPRCAAAKLPHTVCPTCGFYKNRAVIDVS